MGNLSPKTGQFMLCTEFWTQGGKTFDEALAAARKEVQEGDDCDVCFVVEIRAVVTLRKEAEVT